MQDIEKLRYCKDIETRFDTSICELEKSLPTGSWDRKHTII